MGLGGLLPSHVNSEIERRSLMKSKVQICAVAVALVGVSRAQAASITINEAAGPTYYTNGFTDFSVAPIR